MVFAIAKISIISFLNGLMKYMHIGKKANAPMVSAAINKIGDK